MTGTPVLKGWAFFPPVQQELGTSSPSPKRLPGRQQQPCTGVGSGHSCGLAANVSFCFCQLRLQI